MTALFAIAREHRAAVEPLVQAYLAALRDLSEQLWTRRDTLHAGCDAYASGRMTVEDGDWDRAMAVVGSEADSGRRTSGDIWWEQSEAHRVANALRGQRADPALKAIAAWVGLQASRGCCVVVLAT